MHLSMDIARYGEFSREKSNGVVCWEHTLAPRMLLRRVFRTGFLKEMIAFSHHILLIGAPEIVPG
jgi:hypothetical protein